MRTEKSRHLDLRRMDHHRKHSEGEREAELPSGFVFKRKPKLPSLSVRDYFIPFIRSRNPGNITDRRRKFTEIKRLPCRSLRKQTTAEGKRLGLKGRLTAPQLKLFPFFSSIQHFDDPIVSYPEKRVARSRFGHGFPSLEDRASKMNCVVKGRIPP